MKKKGTVDERLAELRREFEASLRIHPRSRIENLDTLVAFGLTIDEAKYWLEHEPNFMPSDDSYHDSSNRRKVTRTIELQVSQ